MVVSLGLGKFYGSSLPRPRFYMDVTLNEERIDPPLPVMEPLLSWAREAHWSMGGLSYKRCRLQGKIEGDITKLRKQQEKVNHESEWRASRLASMRDEHEEESLEDDAFGATRAESASVQTGDDVLRKSASPDKVNVALRRLSKRGKRKMSDEAYFSS